MFKQVTRLNSGFSIVELMVVIAIFGILMAIGIPAYKDYIVKSRLTHVVKVLDSYLDKAKQGYINSGTIPATVMDVASGSDTAVTNLANIDYIYYNNSSSWANAGKAAMVQAVVSSEIGNSIEGYTAGTLGQYNRITLAFVIVDDQMQIYCGSWTSDTVDIPQEFLPSGCEDMGFAGTVMG